MYNDDIAFHCDNTGDLKSDLVSLGVVDGAIHCLQTSSFLHVQFKALGVLRLLVQKQSMYVLIVTCNK